MFDCCRAQFEAPGTRGVGESNGGVEVDEEGNCILIFGCKPSGTVAAISTIATEFIGKLEENIQADGSIKFPEFETF